MARYFSFLYRAIIVIIMKGYLFSWRKVVFVYPISLTSSLQAECGFANSSHLSPLKVELAKLE